MTEMRASTEPSYADCSAPRQRERSGGGHSHAGGHDHGHDGAAHAGARGLRGALVLTSIFLIAEVAGGLLSNSLTLLADAGHLFTDVGALSFSLFVVWLPPPPAPAGSTNGAPRLGRPAPP